MEDIAPKLLKKLQDEFQEEMKKNRYIDRLYKKIKNGNATYKDADMFAIAVGESLGTAFKKNFSSKNLPDGRLYYNIANRTIRPMLEKNHELIVDVSVKVQEILNQKSRIGIKAIRPDVNEDKIKGIIDLVSGKEKYDDIAYMLDEPIVNFSQSVVTDTVRVNAEFHYKAGLDPKIVRTSAGKCCKWCDKVAGTYDYNDYDTSFHIWNDVFRRHKNCRCLVEYRPGDGHSQDVHTKKWKKVGVNDRIKSAKSNLDYLGRATRNQRFRTASMSSEEFARGKKLWKEYDEISIPASEKEKIYEEFDNNLTAEEKEFCIVHRPIGNYWYKAIHLGHNQYKIIGKQPIEKYDSIIDEVMEEMFGSQWRDL